MDIYLIWSGQSWKECLWGGVVHWEVQWRREVQGTLERLNPALPAATQPPVQRPARRLPAAAAPPPPPAAAGQLPAPAPPPRATPPPRAPPRRARAPAPPPGHPAPPPPHAARPRIHRRAVGDCPLLRQARCLRAQRLPLALRVGAGSAGLLLEHSGARAHCTAQRAPRRAWRACSGSRGQPPSQHPAASAGR